MSSAEIRALAAAMREVVAEPVVPERFADRVGQAYRQRLRRRVFVTLVVAALLAVAVLVVPALGVWRPQRYGWYYDRNQVIGGTGTVIAAPGEPVVFCDRTRASLDFGSARPPRCPLGIRTVGVDLDALVDREEEAGVVWGDAWLAGVYRNGTFHVRDQSYRGAARPWATLDEVPCSTPRGGWPRTPPDLYALEQYRFEHPGQIVGYDVRGSRFQRPTVVMVAARDVAAVTAALRPAYGKALCVRHADMTVADVRRAEEAVVAFMADHREVYMTSAAGLDERGRVRVPMGVDLVTPEVEAFLASLPRPYLVDLEVWLAPVAFGGEGLWRPR